MVEANLYGACTCACACAVCALHSASAVCLEIPKQIQVNVLELLVVDPPMAHLLQLLKKRETIRPDHRNLQPPLDPVHKRGSEVVIVD